MASHQTEEDLWLLCLDLKCSLQFQIKINNKQDLNESNNHSLLKLNLLINNKKANKWKVPNKEIHPSRTLTSAQMKLHPLEDPNLLILQDKTLLLYLSNLLQLLTNHTMNSLLKLSKLVKPLNHRKSPKGKNCQNKTNKKKSKRSCTDPNLSLPKRKANLKITKKRVNILDKEMCLNHLLISEEINSLEC